MIHRFETYGLIHILLMIINSDVHLISKDQNSNSLFEMIRQASVEQPHMDRNKPWCFGGHQRQLQILKGLREDNSRHPAGWTSQTKGNFIKNTPAACARQQGGMREGKRNIRVINQEDKERMNSMRVTGVAAVVLNPLVCTSGGGHKIEPADA